MDPALRNDAWTVVGLGEALFDCFPERVILGGAPVNVAVHAGQLLARGRGRAVVVSRVGTDALGDRLVRELEARGLDTTFIQRNADHATGNVHVHLDAQRHATYTISENVAWDHIAFNADLERLAAGCSAVCFGTLAQRSPVSRRTIQRFLAAATHAIRLYDVNLRQRYYSETIIRESLAGATLAKLNEEELPLVADLLGLGRAGATDADLDAMAQALCSAFPLHGLVLTRGARGTTLYLHGRRYEGTPVGLDPEPGADSVGAGDASAAAIICGLLRQWPPAEIVQAANVLGAYVASRAGATPTLPGALVAPFRA